MHMDGLRKQENRMEMYQPTGLREETLSQLTNNERRRLAPRHNERSSNCRHAEYKTSSNAEDLHYHDSECDDSEDRELEIKVRLAEINDEFQKAMSLVSVDDDNNLVIEQRLTELIMEKEKLNKELAKYSDEDSANSDSKANEIVRLTDILENQPLQFNDELIRQMLQCVVVESKERIKVIFNDGTEIDQPIL